MLRHLQISIVAVMLVSAAAAMADNDDNYTRFRGAMGQAAFDPADYDVSRMTPSERVAFRARQQEMRQQRFEERSSAEYDDASQMVSEL